MRLCTRGLRPILLAVGLACAASACLAADTAQPWQLVFFHPPRPGVLQECEDAHLRENYARMAVPDAADPLKAWVVEGPVVLQWPGGQLVQADSGTATHAHPPMDMCFTLQVNGRPLVSGAVVPQYSARLLRFPTLVRLPATPGATAVQFRLQPRFPALAEEPGPPAWSVLGSF